MVPSFSTLTDSLLPFLGDLSQLGSARLTKVCVVEAEFLTFWDETICINISGS